MPIFNPVLKGMNTKDATAKAGDILAGKTAYTGEGKITGTLESFIVPNLEYYNPTVTIEGNVVAINFTPAPTTRSTGTVGSGGSTGSSTGGGSGGNIPTTPSGGVTTPGGNTGGPSSSGGNTGGSSSNPTDSHCEILVLRFDASNIPPMSVVYLKNKDHLSFSHTVALMRIQNHLHGFWGVLENYEYEDQKYYLNYCDTFDMESLKTSDFFMMQSSSDLFSGFTTIMDGSTTDCVQNIAYSVRSLLPYFHDGVYNDYPELVGYVITFDPDGGSCDKARMRTNAEGRLVVSLPVASGKDGYAFAGWQIPDTGVTFNMLGVTNYIPDYTFASDTVLSALWKPSS